MRACVCGLQRDGLKGSEWWLRDVLGFEWVKMSTWANVVSWCLRKCPTK